MTEIPNFTVQKWSAIFLFLAPLIAFTPAEAALRSEVVSYRQGGVELEGYVAWDTARDTARDTEGPAKMPGVLLIHDWMGISDHVRERARELAKAGYVAFAADIYGKSGRPIDEKQAGALAGKWKADRKLLRLRAMAGLETLAKRPEVDPGRLAVLGYCFGGTTALELARSGADLRGAVCFHCHLDTPDPSDARKIKGRVLVLQGGEDPFVPPEQLAAFQKEMKDAHVNWRMILYGGAVHSFTIPGAGSDASKGAAYHGDADRRSQEELRGFLREIF